MPSLISARVDVLGHVVRTTGRALGATFACALVVAAASWSVGCNELGVGPFSGGGSGGSTAAATIVVPPRPVVEITSPARASFLAVGRVAIEGNATSATSTSAPIALVLVNGDPVPLDPDGTFRTFVDLVPGLNVIEAAVTDGAGKTSATAVGVLAGDWLPLGQPVARAASLRLNQQAFDGIAKVAEQGLWALDLAHLLRAPIVDAVFLGFVHTQVQLLNPRFHDVQAQLQAQPDGLRVEIVLERPFIDVVGTVSLLVNPEFASAIADRVVIRGRARALMHPDQRLGFVLEDVSVRFEGFQAHFHSGSFLATIASLLQGLIQSELEKLLEREIIDLNPLIAQALDDYTGGQTTFDIFGKPFRVDLRGESVTHDTTGFSAAISFDAPPVALTARAQAAPGSFHTPGLPPATLPNRGVVATVDDDLLNRLFYGAWAGGLLEHDLTPQLLQQQSVALPSGGFTLGDIAQLMPELVGVAPANAQLGVRVDAGLPPVFRVTGQPDLVEIELGEAYVDVLIDRGQGMETLFRAAIHIQLGATATIDQLGVQLTSARNARVAVDLLDAPIVRIDGRRLQVMLTTVLTPLIPRLINHVTVVPIPFVTQLTLFDLQAFADGPDGDFLTISVDLLR